MTTRAQQRAARAAARRAEQQAEDRRRTVARFAVVGVLAAVTAAAVGVAIATSGADGDADTVASSGIGGGGLLTTAPPWAPQEVGLAGRVQALGFPDPGDESYHAHTLLSVFRNGEQVEVPADIGFDTRGTHSSLHTHTPDGVIHMEADDPYPYELSQVFQVWGVAFDEDRLGGDVATGDQQVFVYVNGKPAPPGPVVLKDQDNIVVAYGTPGSFPVLPPADALAGA